MKRLITAAGAALALSVGVIIYAPHALSAPRGMDNIIIAVQENQAGGEIHLLRHKGECPDGSFAVLTTDYSGLVLMKGCWAVAAERVTIVWETGEASIFRPDAFTLVGRNR